MWMRFSPAVRSFLPCHFHWLAHKRTSSNQNTKIQINNNCSVAFCFCGLSQHLECAQSTFLLSEREILQEYHSICLIISDSD